MNTPAETARREPRPWDGSDLEFHDLCTMFPPMAADVFDELVESVQEDGPMRPVVLHEGKVLDGRHAYRAYRKVGVSFSVVDWSGEHGTPLKFVIRTNLVRRDYTPGQRAALAVEYKKRLNEQYRDRSIANLKDSGKEAASRVGINSNSAADARADARSEAAETLGVNDRYLSDAERIQEASPQVFAEVKNGEKTIPQAKRELGLSKPRPAKGETLAYAAKAPTDGDSLTPTKAKVTAVEDPGEDETDIEAIREEYQEQAAKRDDLTDEEWLRGLPLTSQLQGHVLDKFRRDAVYYRRFEPVRRALSAFHGKARKECFKGAAKQGYVSFRVGQLLSVEHPKSWFICPPEHKGGCNGTGVVGTIGDCPECKGRGYLAR